LEPVSFLTAVSLLGRILKNSEFTDAQIKLETTTQYIDLTIKICILYIDMISEMTRDIVKEKGQGKIEPEVIQYIMASLFTMFFANKAGREAGTEKLFATLQAIFDGSSASLGQTVIIAIMFLGLTHHRWLYYWTEAIKRAKNKRFIIEVLLQVLVLHTKTRFLTDAQRKNVEKAADLLEEALGKPKGVKANTIQTIQAAAFAVREEDES
jgi:hypothetical protein